MKKIVTIILTASMCIFLCGCTKVIINNKENTQDSAKEESGKNNDTIINNTEVNVKSEETIIENNINVENNRSKEIINSNNNLMNSMSYGEQRILNTFMSNFSETYMKSFNRNSYSKEEMIRYIILHAMFNNSKEVQSIGNDFFVRKEYVDAKLDRFLGISINHGSTGRYTYVGNGYRCGAFTPDCAKYFTQTTEMYNNNDGTFTVRGNIYSIDGCDGLSSNDWIYENKSLWKSNYNIERTGTIEGIVEKVSVNGKNDYKLIKYEER